MVLPARSMDGADEYFLRLRKALGLYLSEGRLDYDFHRVRISARRAIRDNGMPPLAIPISAAMLNWNHSEPEVSMDRQTFAAVSCDRVLERRLSM